MRHIFRHTEPYLVAEITHKGHWQWYCSVATNLLQLFVARLVHLSCLFACRCWDAVEWRWWSICEWFLRWCWQFVAGAWWLCWWVCRNWYPGVWLVSRIQKLLTFTSCDLKIDFVAQKLVFDRVAPNLAFSNSAEAEFDRISELKFGRSRSRIWLELVFWSLRQW